MDQVYKSRRIQTWPGLSPDANYWVPHAVISWDEQGVEQRHVITGPSDRFRLIDHADIYAVEMAMAWIDDGLMDDLTP